MEQETARSISKAIKFDFGNVIFYNRSHTETVPLSLKAFEGVNLICLEQSTIIDHSEIKKTRSEIISAYLERKEEDVELNTLLSFAKQNSLPIVFVDLELEEILGSGLFSSVKDLEPEYTRREMLAIIAGTFSLGGLALKGVAEYIPDELKRYKYILNNLINIFITPTTAYLLAYGGANAVEIVAKIILFTTLKKGHVKAESIRFTIYKISQRIKEFVDPHLDGVFINLRNKIMAYKTTVATLNNKNNLSESNILIAPGAAHASGIIDSLYKDLNSQVEEIYKLCEELNLVETLKKVIGRTTVCRWNQEKNKWDIEITNDTTLSERFNKK